MSLALIAIEEAFVSAWNDPSPAYTDITPWFRGLSSRRGRNRDIDKFDAGALTLRMDNRDGRFFATNPAGPYYGNVKPLKRVRVRVDWNRLTANQASIETDASGWADNSGGFTAVSRTTSQSLSGAASLQLQRLTSNGNVAAITNLGSWLRVDPGDVVSALASFRAATAARGCQVSIVYFDQFLVQLSGTNSSTVVCNTTGWTQVTVTDPHGAPPNTSYAAVQVVVNGAVATEVFYVDCIGLFPAPNITLWSPGGPSFLYTGFVLDYAYTFGRADAEAEITCTDILGMLASKKLNITTAYQDAVLADTPDHFYRLGEGFEATTAIDQSGNGHDADLIRIISGAPGAIIADVNTAADFDSRSGIVWAPDTGPFGSAASSPWTFEGWVNTEEMGDQGDVILYAGPLSSTTNSIRITLDSSGGVYVVRVDLPGYILDGNVNVDDGAWHHVAVTWAGAAVGNPAALKIYVDGVLDNSGNAIFTADADVHAVALGARWDATVGPLKPLWPGRMDEVAFYPSVLSAARVAAHAAFGPSSWGTQHPGDRLGKVLDVLAVSAADRNLDTGAANLQAVTGSIVTTDGLEYANNVAWSEQDGMLFAAGDGRVTFYGSAHSVGASQATFGDRGGSDLPYSPNQPRMSSGLSGVYTEVSMQRVGGALKIAGDGTTPAQSLPPRTGLLNTADSDVLALAQHVLAKKKDVQLRVEELIVNPFANDALWPVVLALEIGALITLVKTTPWAQVINQDFRVEGIRVDVGKVSRDRRWTYVYTLSPA